MDKFLSPIYYFSARPDPNFQFTKLTLLLVALLLVGAVAIRLWRKKWAKDDVLKGMLKRVPGHLMTFSMALLVLLLFRVGGIPLFSMRVWWVALGVIFLYWAGHFAIGFRKEYRERKERMGHHQAKSKYLPRKKR